MGTPVSGNTTSANPTPGASTYSFTHTQNTGSNGLLVLMLTMSNARTYSGATYGGQSMTQLYTINRGGLSQRMAFFYLQNPPTGSNTVEITFNNSVWNPISIHARSFTNSGGIGNSSKTGGQSTPSTQTLTVSDDSVILATACSTNVITDIEIPTGTSKTFTTHNTNKQVGTGALSGGLSAGTISITTEATFGNVTNDRIEVLGYSAPSTGDSDFFLLL